MQHIGSPTTATIPALDRHTDRAVGRRDPRRRAARIAGVGYLLIFALAIFANFGVREAMIVPGDAGATVSNITESIGMFRLGLVAFLAVFVIDVAVAWALHVVFREVAPDFSLMTAWFRVVYTVFLGVALVFFFQVLALLGGAEYLSGIDGGLVEAQVMLALDSFDATWLVGLVAFGVHLLMLGWLVIRSGYVTKALGWLLMAAGAAYIGDTIAHAVVADYSAIAPVMLAVVALPSMFGEGWLGIWLIRAKRLSA